VWIDCSVPSQLLAASTVFSTGNEVTCLRKLKSLVLQCSSSRLTCLSMSPSVCFVLLLMCFVTVHCSDDSIVFSIVAKFFSFYTKTHEPLHLA